MGEQPVRPGQADDAAVGMAGAHQIRPQQAVLARKPVVPVGQQDPEGVAAGGVDLGGQFLRRLLVGVAVGIVDARQDNGVPVPLQGHELVGQHRDAVGGEDFLQRRHSAHGPLVVAGDVVGGGNGRKSPGGLRRVAVRRPPVLVLQIPQKKDVLRLLRGHSRQQVRVVRTERGAVEVAEDHDPAAIKTGGQIGKDRVKPGHLQSGVVPVEKSGQAQGGQGQHGQVPPGAALGMLGHGERGLLRRGTQHVRDVEKANPNVGSAGAAKRRLRRRGADARPV